MLRGIVEALVTPPVTSRPDADPDPAGAQNVPMIDAAAAQCAELRRIADERCRGAEAARLQAQTVLEQAAAGQREYDTHRRSGADAERVADPSVIRAAKEAAHRQFRSRRGRGSDHEAEEAAARSWLDEINRINHDARDAARTLERENEAARALIPLMERLTLEADAARIAAESAEHACREARDAVARCQEELARGQELVASVGGMTAPPLRRPGAPPEDDGPTIVRLLRGDRDALEALVGVLAPADQDAQRRWRIRIAALVDNVVARAVESSTLEFPGGGFWEPFDRAQAREIAAALSALGYRFDGLGGWADERTPGQRELSLAVGYAGLDPMRIRHWPREQEMQVLFEGVSVAADEWLIGAAGELTLGEMVDALGRRADELTDLWDAWGRLRPLLLAVDPRTVPGGNAPA